MNLATKKAEIEAQMSALQAEGSALARRQSELTNAFAELRGQYRLICEMEAAQAEAEKAP